MSGGDGGGDHQPVGVAELKATDQRQSALAALAVAATLVNASCTAVSTKAPATVAGPKILRIVGAQELDTLPPLLSNDQDSIDCSMFWAGYFFNLDDRGELVPELATEVPTLENGGISRDGLKITYHLRKGVTWQDGEPFDARDVRFSWQAIMNTANNVASRTGYNRVLDVQVLDLHTVRFLLKPRYAPAVDTFFAPSAGPIALLPQHLLARYPDLNRVPYDVKPVGTGPFIVDSWEQGVGVTMHANPHYWRGRPKLDGVRFLTAHDHNTMLVMMRTGEADLYYRVPDGQITQLRTVAGTHTTMTPFVAYYMLLFNVRHAPLNDPVVRRAISYAIAKRQVVADITHGSGTIAKSDQPPWLWAADAGAPQYDDNPVRARALLAADGWVPSTDGFRVKGGERLSIAISTAAGSNEGAAFEALFGQWMQSVGIEVEVKNYPTDLLYATYGGGGILAAGKFDAAFFDWYNGIDPDDSIQWECGYIPPAGQNFSGWCDPQFDAAETIGLTSYSRAARASAYVRAQERLARGLPADFLYFVGRTDVVSDRVVGYRPARAVTTFWNTWQYDLK